MERMITKLEVKNHLASYAPSIRKNLRLVLAEHSLAEGLICMSILSPFYLSIGMSYAEVTLSQAIFTIAVMLLDIPMGYIADRFSRKWANAIGDIGCALIHLYYATARNFTMVVISEIGLGIFYSLSSGVDASLLRHFVKKGGGSEAEFQSIHARMIMYGNMMALILVLLGGPIGAISFRLAIGVSGVPRLLAGILSILIDDDSDKLAQSRGGLGDMLDIAKRSLSFRKLRTRIFAYAVVRKMSHPMIWILTPILLAAGVPLFIVSIAWAIDSVMRTIGNKLAEIHTPHLSPFMVVLIPVMGLSVAFLLLAVNISLFTIWIYSLAGLSCGWTGAALIPLVQAETPPEVQTTVISVAKTIANLLYVPMVWLTGIMADIGLGVACGFTVAVFLPLAIPILIALKRE